MLRQAAASLAIGVKTPVPYWLSMTLLELMRWISDINAMERR
ncbi:hypothetical protein [Tumebacillus flagellatus]|nr:hypothetical protein [Tumebacillus flagellatus]